MLASASVGTVEHRSITDPIRQLNHDVQFCNAKVTSVDFARKRVLCRADLHGEEIFELPYDYLVVSIGMHFNTFNTPGVAEHCFFLKELDDARKVRAAIMQQFEAASLPGVPEERIRQLLTFVVVGCGPAGVEMSGELFDFFDQDLRRYFPHLVPLSRKALIHAGKTVLEPFDPSMRTAAMSNLKSIGTDLMMETRVLGITPDEITFRRAARSASGDAPVESMPYGLCLWAAGNAPHDLAQEIIRQLKPAAAGGARTGARIMTDAWMRVVGVEDGSVFAAGDCAEPETGALPQTAMTASQQGEYIARLLNAAPAPSAAPAPVPAE